MRAPKLQPGDTVRVKHTRLVGVVTAVNGGPHPITVRFDVPGRRPCSHYAPRELRRVR